MFFRDNHHLRFIFSHVEHNSFLFFFTSTFNFFFSSTLFSFVYSMKKREKKEECTRMYGRWRRKKENCWQWNEIKTSFFTVEQLTFFFSSVDHYRRRLCSLSSSFFLYKNNCAHGALLKRKLENESVTIDRKYVWPFNAAI